VFKTVGPLLLAFMVTFLGTPLIKRLALRIKAVDKPDPRKIHNRTMPRLGGLAICLGLWAAMLLTQDLSREIIGILLGGLVIVALGIVDDIKGVSPRFKLAGQVLAAVVAMAFGVRVEFLTNPIEGVISLEVLGFGFLSYLLTVFWIIGVTNAINLIDGLDGLAAGVSAIAAVTLGIVAYLEGQVAAAVMSFILAASSAGFLRYNFHPAQLFMGDTGSLFLGFNLASIAIIGLTKGATVVSVLLPIVILGIPIADTFFAIIRRYSNGKPIFGADKDHIHHRLLALGLSHRNTVLVIYGVSVILGLSAIVTSLVTTPQGFVIMLVTILGSLFVADKIGLLRSKDFKLKVRNESKSYQHVAK